MGRSDHNLVYFLFVYKPIVHREPVVTHTVKRWSDETEEALKDCFDSPMWEVLYDDFGEDTDALVNCIMGYINFCVDNAVPNRTVRCFSPDHS